MRRVRIQFIARHGLKLHCPSLIRYPETATGAMLTSIEKIRGRCVENSVAVQDPHNLCKADGTWSFHTGSCACMAGYEADDAGTACKPCTVGRYKASAYARIVIHVVQGDIPLE